MEFLCSECGRRYRLDGLRYRCECGELFQLKKASDKEIKKQVSLGEVKTPIIKRNYGGVDLYLKLDYLLPTGSFKDRGAWALINKLNELGITEIVEDSSGNAGASIAAYSAAADIKCSIYLPADTSEGKIEQIKAYGAEIIRVEGSRKDTTEVVLEAAENTYYASHVYNPLFFEGTKTVAYEIYEEIGVPDYIFSPVGNGTMLLGIYQGFSEIGRLPKIIGVQSANCSPIYDKYKGLSKSEVKSTLAEGIAIEDPMRMDEIIAAIEDSRGDMVKVPEEAIETAHSDLAKMGIYVEPTSAVTVAGAREYAGKNLVAKEGLELVVPLTSSGLKK